MTVLERSGISAHHFSLLIKKIPLTSFISVEICSLRPMISALGEKRFWSVDNHGLPLFLAQATELFLLYFI